MKGNETLRVYNKESIRSPLKGANRAGQMPRWQSDAECSIQKTYLTMEVYNFYCDNVALLYRHFGNFSSNARLFMAPVSFEVKYELFLSKGRKPFQIIRLVPFSIPIGALSLCWDTYRNSSVCPGRGRSFRLYNDVDYFYPQYRKEDMKIDCDCRVQVRKDGQWGYMDGEGNFTLDIFRSCYRNEDDAEK